MPARSSSVATTRRSRPGRQPAASHRTCSTRKRFTSGASKPRAADQPERTHSKGQPDTSLVHPVAGAEHKGGARDVGEGRCRWRSRLQCQAEQLAVADETAVGPKPAARVPRRRVAAR